MGFDIAGEINKSGPDANKGLAYAIWTPTTIEQYALDAYQCVKGINRVDQIWPWLKNNYGEIMAVKAPHLACPENYNYQELADKISIAAAAFNSIGSVSGDVVSLFSENSPRWLIADQGLMRAGASNAVRGASAPALSLIHI